MYFVSVLRVKSKSKIFVFCVTSPSESVKSLIVLVEVKPMPLCLSPDSEGVRLCYFCSPLREEQC